MQTKFITVGWLRGERRGEAPGEPRARVPAASGTRTVLRAADARSSSGVESATIRNLTDGNLSRHLTTLESAGYIKIVKAFEGRKPRTWISATPAVRRALADEIAALREIVGAADTQPHPARRLATGEAAAG